MFKLAEKMVRLSPRLTQFIKVIPSQKSLIGLPMNVEYRAISAEAGTAHGLSPVLAILDEVGQVRGPTDSFIEAIETAQGGARRSAVDCDQHAGVNRWRPVFDLA